MSPTEQKLNTLLTRCLTAITVKGLLRKARERVGEVELSEASLPAVIKSLHSSLRLFLPEAQCAELGKELERLNSQGAPFQHTIPIQREADILLARGKAASMAQLLGANRFVVQRVVTAVSELARNIVNYTPGGQIQLNPLQPPGVRVIAQDEGKGISNLEAIMNGTYRSHSGMGLGLRGIKSLASDFQIETSPRGTLIQIDVTW